MEWISNSERNGRLFVHLVQSQFGSKEGPARGRSCNVLPHLPLTLGSRWSLKMFLLQRNHILSERSHMDQGSSG